MNHEGTFTGKVLEFPMFEALVQLEIDQASYHDLALSLLNVRVHNYHVIGTRIGSMKARFTQQVVEAVRPGDVVGQTGKDDLTILLPNTTGGPAHSVFGRIDHAGGVWTLASGVVTYSNKEDSAASFIRDAQMACVANGERVGQVG